MSDYDDDVIAAYEAIKDASDGLTCDIVRGSTTYHNIPVVIMEFEWHERDGEIIEYQDKKVFVPSHGLAIIPSPELDVLVLKPSENAPLPVLPVDKPLRIVANKPTAPGNRALFHQLQVRA